MDYAKQYLSLVGCHELLARIAEVDKTFGAQFAQIGEKNPGQRDFTHHNYIRAVTALVELECAIANRGRPNDQLVVRFLQKLRSMNVFVADFAGDKPDYLVGLAFDPDRNDVMGLTSENP
ncbi:MAG: hypothetical protein K2Z80_37160 [Xanthobacteraceae bacterium]|nr:hypothetical protein [Xanthobacteraceae bacterium]